VRLADEDDGMHIRAVSDDDMPFLAEMTLLAAFPPGALPKGAASMPHVTRWTTDWGREGDAGVVAEEHGEAVGAAWCRLQPVVLARDDDGIPLPEIAVAVEPEHRSGGIGGVLLAALGSQAASAGFTGLCLAVNEQNPSVRLYLRAGFSTTGRDGTRLTMVKRLASQPSR
jgi:GNAT superfamily N-acetyltransferase